MAEQPNPPLDYVRRLYDNVLKWYEAAERKAQIVLTVDGVFLGLLTASFTSDVSDLQGVVRTFGSQTWACLAAAFVLLLASLLSAVWCLRSRHIYGPQAYLRKRHRPERSAERPSGNDAETMWFFEMIAEKEHAQFVSEARRMDETREIDALASQVWRLSNIVSEKHVWANRAFAATGLALVAFTLAAASYVGMDLSS